MPNTHRHCIRMIHALVSELHDIMGNPLHHRNLGKASDASLTRIDSTQQSSSPVFAINLGAHYNLPIKTINTCTTTHLDSASEIPFASSLLY